MTSEEVSEWEAYFVLKNERIEESRKKEEAKARAKRNNR